TTPASWPRMATDSLCDKSNLFQVSASWGNDATSMIDASPSIRKLNEDLLSETLGKSNGTAGLSELPPKMTSNPSTSRGDGGRSVRALNERSIRLSICSGVTNACPSIINFARYGCTASKG